MTSDIESQMRFLAGSYGGSGVYNRELADVFRRGADEIAKLRQIIKWARPRLKRDCYRDRLDEYMNSPLPVLYETSRIVQSEQMEH